MSITRTEEVRDLFRGLRAKKLIAGVDEALAVLAKDFSFGESTDHCEECGGLPNGKCCDHLCTRHHCNEHCPFWAVAPAAARGEPK